MALPNTGSRAVVKSATIPVSNDTAILDKEIVAALLRFIQDTVRYSRDGIADIWLVVCYDGEFLRLSSTSVGELLVAIVCMGVVVLDT
jgi:hypothetical protein